MEGESVEIGKWRQIEIGNFLGNHKMRQPQTAQILAILQ